MNAQASTPRASTARAGMTLMEMIVAMTVLSVVIVGGLGFLSAQSALFSTSVERTTSLTNLRYVISTLVRETRPLGSNITAGQPGLVYAGGDVIAFNADYASNVRGDVFAVHVDPDAPGSEVTAAVGAVPIPTTSFVYPDTLRVTAAGTRSPAELLIFYFEEDTVSSEPDDYTLYRQVNGLAPERIAEGLHRSGGADFFEYSRMSTSGGALLPVAGSDLPLAHTAPIHRSAADTGATAGIDEIRAVTVRATVWPGADTTVARPLRLTRTIPMPNAGLDQSISCGAAPLLGTPLAGALIVLPSGDPAVELSWAPAVDESGGEGDVIRYVLWRRQPPQGTWGNPYLSIAAGAPSYTYTDAEITPGETYEYALAAQDCTPSLSPLSTTGGIDVH